MAILVTGAAGYIGSFAARRLIASGFEVIAFDNLTTGFRNSLPRECKFIEGDICSESDVAALFKSFQIDAIIHFAAKTVVPESIKDPISYFDNNFNGSLKLFKAALKADVKRVIFSSTAAVYAPTKVAMIAEGEPCGPINPYGESKWHTEHLLRDLHISSGLNYIALRYFNVAGACLENKLGQKTLNATHLIKVAAELAVGKRKYIEIYGSDYETPDGTAVRDYIHVEDLVNAHILALKYLMKNSAAETLNCGYGHGSSVLDVIHTMEKVSEQKLEKRTVARRVGDPGQVVADSKKIKSLLGWSPKYDDLETICRTAYLWERTLK